MHWEWKVSRKIKKSHSSRTYLNLMPSFCSVLLVCYIVFKLRRVLQTAPKVFGVYKDENRRIHYGTTKWRDCVRLYYDELNGENIECGEREEKKRRHTAAETCRGKCSFPITNSRCIIECRQINMKKVNPNRFATRLYYPLANSSGFNRKWPWCINPKITSCHANMVSVQSQRYADISGWWIQPWYSG